MPCDCSVGLLMASSKSQLFHFKSGHLLSSRAFRFLLKDLLDRSGYDGSPYNTPSLHNSTMVTMVLPTTHPACTTAAAKAGPLFRDWAAGYLLPTDLTLRYCSSSHCYAQYFRPGSTQYSSTPPILGGGGVTTWVTPFGLLH